MKNIIKTNLHDVTILDFPSVCPHCHKSIIPNPLYGYLYKTDGFAVLMHCPNHQCIEPFIAYYVKTAYSTAVYIKRTSIGKVLEKTFEEVISQISENFVVIYNQALAAEQYGLIDICGVGYRKSLEFLIKDYTISKHPDKVELIKSSLLGNCIKTYIKDSNIQSVAKRATWLGNDETHYIKRWEGKDLKDLKKLIDLVIHWIAMEALTRSFEEEMPD